MHKLFHFSQEKLVIYCAAEFIEKSSPIDQVVCVRVKTSLDVNKFPSMRCRNHLSFAVSEQTKEAPEARNQTECGNFFRRRLKIQKRRNCQRLSLSHITLRQSIIQFRFYCRSLSSFFICPVTSQPFLLH